MLRTLLQPFSAWCQRNRESLFTSAAYTCVLVHVLMCAWGASRLSPTVDEPAYLAAGVSHWHFGRCDLAKVSPPLVRLAAAIPVCLASPVCDWSHYQVGPGIRTEHSVGRDFLVANGRRSFWLFTMARWACIPFSILGAYVCYQWSGQLWGQRSGFAALVLWCFCPNILAHGQLMTPDVGVTALSVAAAYYCWRWVKDRTWSRVLVAGLMLGLAVLAKTNGVALVIVLPPLALMSALRTPGSLACWRSIVGQVVALLMVACYVVNLGYGFDGSFERLDRYEFASRIFRGTNSTGTIGNRFQGTAVGWIPFPLPKPFLEGIDLQRRDFENESKGAKTYFRGEWYDHGWWWYYFYVVAVKVPLGAWVLFLGALALQVWKEGLRGFVQSDFLFVAVPGAALFALACSQTGFGHSLRYVLPAFPFVYVFAGSLFRENVHRRLITIVAWISLGCHVASSLSVYPYSLSYYNELAGGPLNGHAHLLDGNLDWGQDLLSLERWIKAHPEARPLHVAYWGFLPLSALGVDYSEFELKETDDSPGATKPIAVPPGWYAISVNNLRGDYRLNHRKYRSFLERTPVDRVGYSIYLYHVPAEPGHGEP